MTHPRRRSSAHRAVWRPFVPILTTLLLIVGVGVAGVGAAGAAAEDPAISLLERAAEHYRGLESLGGDLEVLVELPKGIPAGAIPPLVYGFATHRPASIAFRTEGDSPAPSLVQDGKQRYSEMQMFGQYILEPASEELDWFLETDKELALPPGLELLVSLMSRSAKNGVLEEVTRVSLIGEEDQRGVPCHRLKIEGGLLEGDIWIARGEEPWVMRHQEAEIAPPEPGSRPTMRPRLDLRFSGWDSETDLSGAFEIAPGANLEKVDVFSPPRRGPGGDSKGPHPSIGKPAPAVTITPMKGDPVELSSLKGKVVVLDFWASWCRPCVMALPGTTKVAADLASKGLVFYAVNQAESASKVRGFLAQQKLDPPVALDPKSAMGRAFGASGIPHLVVIGRDGIVKHVHVGYAPGMEETLRKECEALLGS